MIVMMEQEPIEYSIAFDGNNADDGEMESIEATYDEEYTLTANTFTRAGYKFTGWNTEADGSGTSYEDEATVSNLTTTDGETVTLYSQWEPITYTITFDSNGADDGEMESIEATYDEEYTLTANTFTRAGYKFTGWNTEADGSGTSYEDGETVSNLTTEDGATVTLYAQWKEYTITVTEYTGDSLEAEFDYEDFVILLYVVDGVSLEQMAVSEVSSDGVELNQFYEEKIGYGLDDMYLYRWLTYEEDDAEGELWAIGEFSTSETAIFTGYISQTEGFRTGSWSLVIRIGNYLQYIFLVIRRPRNVPEQVS